MSRAYDNAADARLQQGGRRNLIINGAMQVAQRGTSTTGITADNFSTVDRFQLAMNALGTWTAAQVTDAPNGFGYSHKITCTTADASPAADDYILCLTRIEAQDLQSLSYGNSNAQSIVLSFYIKSNKTGTGSIRIRQRDNSNKQVTPSYTISSADTWERKTIVIPGDTSGVINNDNGQGFDIAWLLNSGSTYSGGSNQTTWAASDATDMNASNLGVGGAISDYFAITGVQLELGNVATPFEHRSYGEELALCQRYYQRHRYLNILGYQNGTTQIFTQLPVPVVLRDSPSITYGASSVSVATAGTPDYNPYTISSIVTGHTPFLEYNCSHPIRINLSGWSGNDDDVCFLFPGNTDGFTLDAEL